MKKKFCEIPIPSNVSYGHAFHRAELYFTPLLTQTNLSIMAETSNAFFYSIAEWCALFFTKEIR